MDICVITRDKCEYLRNYVSHDKKAVEKAQPYSFPLGGTPFLQETSLSLQPIQLDRPLPQDKMELL